MSEATQSQEQGLGPELSRAVAMGTPLKELSTEQLGELLGSKGLSHEMQEALHHTLDARGKASAEDITPEKEVEATRENAHESIDKKVDLHDQSVAFRETGTFITDIEVAREVAHGDITNLPKDVLAACVACGHGAVDGTRPAANAASETRVETTEIAQFAPDSVGEKQAPSQSLAV